MRILNEIKGCDLADALNDMSDDERMFLQTLIFILLTVVFTDVIVILPIGACDD
jgi:hypothetical protein